MLTDDGDAGAAACPWRAADMSASTAQATTAPFAESLTTSIAASPFR